MVDNRLNLKHHIKAQVNKANSIMGLIRRTYTFLDESSFKYLYTALVRPHLEYAIAVWNPSKKRVIVLIENVQWRATKQVPSLKNLDYMERLKVLNLPTLRYRGDMIEVFKILRGVYDQEVSNNILELNANRTTRGHNWNLNKSRCRLDV